MVLRRRSIFSSALPVVSVLALAFAAACGGESSTDDSLFVGQQQDAGYEDRVDGGTDADAEKRDAGTDARTDARVANRYVRVRISGIVGRGLVLQNTGLDDLAPAADGDYTFATALARGDAYAVTVLTAPSNPTQACSVVGGAGLVADADVNVVVTCETSKFTIGGNVNGVLGAGLALYNNGGDTRMILGSGPFSFATPIPSGNPFSVTVAAQPANPSQTCMVAGGSGVVGTADVQTVAVNCTTNSFSVGGHASGLEGSLVVELQRTGQAPPSLDAGSVQDATISADAAANPVDAASADAGADAGSPGTQTATLTANGTWAFGAALPSGARFTVTLKTQPSQPSQACVFARREQGDAGAPVVAYDGTIDAADINDIDIVCTTRGFTVGGLANWLGGTLVLQNANDAIALTEPAGQAVARAFTLPTAVLSGRTYSVSVLSAPTSPPQICTVVQGTGTIAASNASNVLVRCTLAGCATNFGNCDANDLNGCEANFVTNTSHCGGCGTVCTATNGTPSCVAGQCAVGTCNTGYANCDGVTTNGCEVNTTTAVSNCGSCGNVCAPANATGVSCTNGACAFTTCSAGFANCDNLVSTGCEQATATSLTNCGGCGNTCSFAHASAACGAGVCIMGACAAGHYNLDGSVSNGCEYACTYTGAIDAPDDAFADANCDGIDGTIASAIFVATGGSDANPGTKAAPKATIIAGLTAAVSQGKSALYVSGGTYTGSLTLANGISIYGGYDAANNWARSGTPVVIVRETSASGPSLIGVAGLNIASPTVLDRLTIQAATTSSSGVSVYGLWCSGCTGLSVKNTSIEAGNAGAGTAGSAGTVGASGSVGGYGGAGECDSNSGGASGTSGASSCGRTGGGGGYGGYYTSNGSGGGTGIVGTSGGGGGGGGGGGNGSGGSQGSGGSAGSDATGGTGGSVTAGGLWSGNGGGNGSSGTAGNGGGGGGGGGGQDCGWWCPYDGTGNGGGGGGGAGCGGTAGAGGTAGGGSFGAFLVSSTGASFSASTLRGGTGGQGGAAGNGGGGGTGANGGSGGTTCTSEVGAGGNGGRGGDGARGGHGGGGAGGPSYGLYKATGTTSVATSGVTLSNGNGGQGGASTGQSGTVGAAAQSN